MGLLNQESILVTGGSHGFGRALCHIMAQNGAKVAFNYSTDDSAAEESLRDIINSGAEGMKFKTSVLDRLSVEKMVAEIENKWGRIDILINNAGVNQMLPIALIEEEDWDYVMDVNIKGMFIVTKAVLKGMIRRRSGRILNISSLAGVRMIEAPLHYSASKAGARGFTEALAKEVARYQIRVNCLAPGLMDQGVGKELPIHRVQEYLKHCSLGRVGKIEEVAYFAAFIVSQKNSYMNGTTIVMSGGL